MNRGPRAQQVSSKSRSKLNAFRFNKKDDPSPDKSQKTSLNPGHADKENQTSWLNGVLDKGKSEPNSQNLAVETTEPKPSRECPQTPGNRIPLADLIGNAEDAFSRLLPQEFTPEDNVVWQHLPASSNADKMSRTPAMKSKKRRHSSSPTSSPLAGTPKSRRKGSFDLQNNKGLIETPQNDLATDLWNNYAGKNLSNAKGELPQPRLANLLSSSPQTPVSVRTGRDSSGLRRSNSCIAEWPSSKAKRRRTDTENLGTGRSIFSRTRSNIVDSGSYQSPNISALVKRIEKTLQNTPAPDPGVSDSSPVPARNHVRPNRSASPVEERITVQPLGMASQAKDPRFIPAAPQDRKTLEESSSDYGDDDFDQDFLDLAEASMDPFVDDDSSNSQKAVLSKERANGIAPEADLPINLTNDSIPPAINAKPKADVPKNNEPDLNADEFDDDFDGISDTMDDLLVECDGTPSIAMAGPFSKEQSGVEEFVPGTRFGNTPASRHEELNATKTSPETFSGDEFDDDALDIEAIEQSMKSRSRQAIKRYLIVDIAESAYTTPKGRVQPAQVCHRLSFHALTGC
ncbi:hypothetical protein BO71DRAFT_314863 [Aspergillus ellipticus CBS 707.79]|uniref:Uncharacterized protein n=1 Tax=Aspergillus ellipticus CBS 707.79 TaxID=1448320 RepID=A0A319DN94_9EURO|nr:hypothetical protein BO71DRAFT_314863 [Aspergillus ellipticus CBS 707.79]